MKTAFFCFLLAVFAGSLAMPQTASTNGAKKKNTKKKAGVKKKAVSAAASRQMAPTPDRYREIQQALVDKGYLKSEPNGVWDDQSAEALKQFQNDRHLSPTGKISALSLIDLGLGPKQSTAPVTVPAPGAVQGAHSPDPDALPSVPETLPPPEN